MADDLENAEVEDYAAKLASMLPPSRKEQSLPDIRASSSSHSMSFSSSSLGLPSMQKKPSREDEMYLVRTLRKIISSKRKLYGHRLQNLASIFSAIDRDGSGTVDKEEFVSAMRRLGIGLSQRSMEAIFEAMDVDGGGEIELNEFITEMHKAFPDEVKIKEPNDHGSVTIVRASGLKAADLMGNEELGSDPYAEIWWNDELVGTTEVELKTCEPRWNFRCALKVGQHSMNVLRVEVFDHDDTLIDSTPDFLGRVMLVGEGNSGMPNRDVTYPLTRRPVSKDWTSADNEMVAGILTLRYESADQEQDRLTRTNAYKNATLDDLLATPHITCTLDFSFADLVNSTMSAAAVRAALAYAEAEGVPADPEALYAPIKNQIAEAAYTRDVQEWDGTSMKRIFEGRDRKNTGMQRRRSSGVHRSRSSSSTCVSKRKKVVVTKGVNLSHNNLHTIRHLPEALAPYMSFHNCMAIQLLDLSSNQLRALEPTVLQAMPSLRSLLLHANRFPPSYMDELLRTLGGYPVVRAASRAASVASTASTTMARPSAPRDGEIGSRLGSRLRRLTLHGSPLEEKTQPLYRDRVLAALPYLKQLDFNVVTRSNRKEARLNLTRPAPRRRASSPLRAPRSH